ncbi:translation initiation factor IF-2, mitochondrial-like isoform X2 [Ctenocephalides felis]|uniref:translation initiation factor IF-2, mitochondrial-like isoform X2 n=1 Tax=Ctenocephalides felis TaxID=7515 RepID=UPI000E6E1B8E|nr:translation initiation factor IF-2, mitochondrial-like isoform X2 [Ctenocephalides felis]
MAIVLRLGMLRIGQSPRKVCAFQTFFTGPTSYKRRKTSEERKSPKLIEYSPKSKLKKDGPTIDIWRNMTINDLAKSMGKDLEQVQEIGLYVEGLQDIHKNFRLDNPKITKEIVSKAGFKSRIVPVPQTSTHTEEKVRDVFPRPPLAPDDPLLKPRPPVVTVMGHVDHGKTSLLDALRGTSVAAGEAGGITQHIGAFTVALDHKDPSSKELECVTFLDTPGHAAFGAMRARGANVTDLIVLVVAADDSVMAQTKEVIALAKEADVPLIVAINKIDKPNADVERVKRDLLAHGVNLEGMGGEVQWVPISATKGTGLDELVEALSVQAQIMGLKSDYTGPVEGWVIETRTDEHKGKLATALVTRGTLRRGNILVSGLTSCRVRALYDHHGDQVTHIPAGPGIPVEVAGWRDLPKAGDQMIEVESEKMASSVLHYRENIVQQTVIQQSQSIIEAKAKAHEEVYKAEREARRKKGFFKNRRTGPRPKEYVDDKSGPPSVSIIIKGDVHGSVEAILDVLDTYHHEDDCILDLVHYGVGDVTENDVVAAKTFNSVIYAFNVKVKEHLNIPGNVKVKHFDIIYRLVDDLKEEISNKLPLKPVEEIIGEATVLQTFAINEGKHKVTVMGCRCTQGSLKKSSLYRLERDGEVIHQGKLVSMRHVKTEVDTIKKDIECGLRFEDQSIEIKQGDRVVCYKVNHVPQFTEWNPGF